MIFTSQASAHGSSHHKTICVDTRQMYDLYQICTKYSYGKEVGTYTNFFKYYYTQEEMDKRQKEQTRVKWFITSFFLLGIGLMFYLCCILMREEV